MKSFTPKQIFTGLIAVGILAVIAWLAFDNGAARIWTFFVEFCIFMVQAVMLVVGALALQYGAMWVRAQAWFDKNGAGAELGKVEARVGTPKERDSDAVALAVKYTGWTLFTAVLLLANFLLHTP